MTNQFCRMGCRLALAIALFSAVLTSRAQQPIEPSSLPAHDTHQGLLVAVNPYISAGVYKTKFGKHTPYDAGILALEIFFRNDTDGPIRLNLATIRLLIGQPGESRQKLEPLSANEVADDIFQKPVKDPSQRRYPFPGSGSGSNAGHDKKWDETAALLRSSALVGDVIAPHSTLHGFFYFDVNHRYDWLSNAHFYVPDLTFLLDNKALFFFDVDLSSAAP